MNLLEKLNLIKEIEDELPHGSGIDGKWYSNLNQNTNNVTFTNSYHCMNDIGFYDGWAEFSITVPIKDPLKFKLHFHGKDSQYLNRKYDLRYYLEESIALVLDNLFSKPLSEKEFDNIVQSIGGINER